MLAHALDWARALRRVSRASWGVCLLVTAVLSVIVYCYLAEVRSHSSLWSSANRQREWPVSLRFEKLADCNVLQDNTLLITVVTSGMHDFVINWINNLRNIGVERYIVIAGDQGIYEELCRRGVAVFLIPYEWQFVGTYSVYPLPQDGSHYEFGTETYARIVLSKLFAIWHVLGLGYDVIFCDVDVAFPRPGIFETMVTMARENPGVEIIGSQEPDGACLFPRLSAPCVNTGLYFLRSRPTNTQALAAAIELGSREPGYTIDQYSLNRIFYDFGLLGLRKSGSNGTDYFPSDPPRRPGKLMMLDLNLAMNGWNYFHNHTFPGRKPPPHVPLAVHANFLGPTEKKPHLQKHGLWFSDTIPANSAGGVDACGECRVQAAQAPTVSGPVP